MKELFKTAKFNSMMNYHQTGLRTVFFDIRAVRDIIKLFPADVRDQVTCYVSGYGDLVHYSITLDDLTGLRDDPRLLSVLEAFSDSEWKAQSHDYTSTGVPNRDFSFTKRIYLQIPESNRHAQWLIKHGFLNSFDVPVTINVSVCAYVKPDSPTCRVVVKGFKEEVVRTEIREVVCE